MLASLWAEHVGVLSAFPFMVIVGLGTYIPYVAYHTTVFERLIAAFRERGNIGYLMYLADATGYLGYVCVMLAKNFMPGDLDFLELFKTTSTAIGVLAVAMTAFLIAHYARRMPVDSPQSTSAAQVAPVGPYRRS